MCEFGEGGGVTAFLNASGNVLPQQWVKTSDKESFTMARRLIREEGLLCGGSSGSAMWAAMQVCVLHSHPRLLNRLLIFPVPLVWSCGVDLGCQAAQTWAEVRCDPAGFRAQLHVQVPQR